jgi:hypothetical protein
MRSRNLNGSKDGTADASIGGDGTAKPRFVRFTFPRNPSDDGLQKIADAINQMRRDRLARKDKSDSGE